MIELSTIYSDTIDRIVSYLSDPARSTRFSLANLKLDAESFSHLLSMIQVKTLWERLLSRFIFVAATLLLAEPWSKFWPSGIFWIWSVYQIFTRKRLNSKHTYLHQEFYYVTDTANFPFSQIFDVHSIPYIFSELHIKKVSKYHGVMLKGHVNLKQQHKSLLGDLWQKDQEDL